MTRIEKWSVAAPATRIPQNLRTEQQRRIIAAADRLLADRGLRGMTMQNVATAAGIGKGTTYLYFRSKQDVALAVVESHIDGTFERLRRIARTKGTPDRRLEDMAVCRVLDRFDRFQHYGEGLHEMLAALRPGLLQQRERQLRVEARIFVPVLRELAATARDADLRHVARAILTATNSLLPYYLSSAQLGARPRIARQSREVARIVVAGAAATLRFSRNPTGDG